MRGAKFFCSLDLAHGFYQIPIAKEDIHKTAFRSGTGGLNEFTRMCFGLTGAPATFMRIMDKLFGDLNFQRVLMYVDDILVFGATIEETLKRLKVVLHRLKCANLKIKPNKCQMFHKKLRYLGHIVSEEGAEPDPGKITAITQWIQRTKVTELWLLPTIRAEICQYRRRSYWNTGSPPTREQSKHESRPVRRVLRQCGRLEDVQDLPYKKAQLNGESCHQLLPPSALKIQVLHATRDNIGHQAFEETLQLVQARYWWSGMATYVEVYCKQCRRCVVSKAKNVKSTMGTLLDFDIYYIV